MQKDKTIKKSIHIDIEDAKILTIHALVSHNLKLKAFIEQVLRDKVAKIKKLKEVK